ncbi:hypothetical protein [Chachezhania sediminis]|uniref:hypothetical protein n=1 Tax=Chachezhania sediminis TaxID=2599291 RepID=UPI00131ECD12|nr:hypothetical protein [Chachezhania sediminis]
METSAFHIVAAVLILAVLGAVAEAWFRRRRSRAPFGPEFDANDPTARRAPPAEEAGERIG